MCGRLSWVRTSWARAAHWPVGACVYIPLSAIEPHPPLRSPPPKPYLTPSVCVAVEDRWVQPWLPWTWALHGLTHRPTRHVSPQLSNNWTPRPSCPLSLWLSEKLVSNAVQYHTMPINALIGSSLGFPASGNANTPRSSEPWPGFGPPPAAGCSTYSRSLLLGLEKAGHSVQKLLRRLLHGHVAAPLEHHQLRAYALRQPHTVTHRHLRRRTVPTAVRCWWRERVLWKGAGAKVMSIRRLRCL